MIIFDDKNVTTIIRIKSKIVYRFNPALVNTNVLESQIEQNMKSIIGSAIIAEKFTNLCEFHVYSKFPFKWSICIACYGAVIPAHWWDLFADSGFSMVKKK